MEETISLHDIAKIIRKRLLLIIILMILSIGIAIGISFYLLTPLYQANTQILVNQNSGPEEVYSWQTTETDLRLINTYNVIITSPVILTPVIEELKLNMTPGQLMNQISVSSESESKVVNIGVLNSDPELAVNISNTVAEVFKEQIPKLMSVDNITILSVAKLSDIPNPVKPNKTLNIAIGAIIGFMLGIGVAILLEILDATVKNESDIEELIGLPVIGVVGFIVEEKEKRLSLFSRRARRNLNV
ncbi:MAG: Wzz/FepE/Etk N-terminal domain-containing protein [Solibacillus sp.]|uniref:YveK family protein n=1 Tax=Solibacillus sp. TaxID=1909654 RepID=UPI00331580AF